MTDWRTIPQDPQIIIIDDFYPDLEWVLPYVESSTPIIRSNVNYGGCSFTPPPDRLDYALKKISEALNVPLKQIPHNGELRLSIEKSSEEYKTFVHVDMSVNVVIYLSGQENDSGGTTFYQHKDLSMTFVHPEHPQKRKLDLLLPFDTDDLSKWVKVTHIPFKKNRAVIFNGRYFHSVPSVFYGKGPRDGRITQNFFFLELHDLFELEKAKEK